MSNIAKKYLQDRDIKNLIARSTQYKKVVGNPKELYILVSPKGNKTFSLRYKDEISKKDKFYKTLGYTFGSQHKIAFLLNGQMTKRK